MTKIAVAGLGYVGLSNAVLLVLLFVIGYHWAGYTTVNRWRAGFSMLLFGGLLVAVAIALGG